MVKSVAYNVPNSFVNTNANNVRLVNFKGNNFTAIPQDTVELSTYPEPKKKRSVGKKILIGLGITASALVVTALAFAKHQSVKLDKLYKEKLVKKLVDKEIVFKEAATKEEAVKYAKEIIGVQRVDQNMTLEVLNHVNKGITDVMNKNVGKEIFVPKSYFYDKIEGELAHVVSDVESSKFGELGINKEYFDNDFLTKKIDEMLKLRGFSKEPGVNKGVNKEVNTGENGLGVIWALDGDLHKLLQIYKENPNNLSVAEKRTLLYSTNFRKKAAALNNQNWVEFVERNKHTIKLDIAEMEEFKKLSNKKQREYINTYLKNAKIPMDAYLYLPIDDGSSVIYHEMGHLQDFAKNLKNLDLKKWKLPSFKETWKEIQDAKDKGEKLEVRGNIDEVSNRWSGTTYGDMGKLFKEKPEKFKKLYPDLYEHLSNKEIQAAARKVSSYAQTSIGEFIAETYAKMIKGEPIPEDVLKLYKKYNGPLPNGF